MRAAALILAGGGSRRMGRDKLSLPWSSEGDKTVLAAVIEVAQSVASRVVLLVPPASAGAAYTAVSTVADQAIHAGPLAALANGWASASGSDPVFVIAGDLPGLAAPVLTACQVALEAAGETCDGALVRREGRWQPLVGCYRARVGQALKTAAAAGEARLTTVLAQLRLVAVDAQAAGWPAWWTRPVHTTADYEAWLTWQQAPGSCDAAKHR